MVFDNYVSNFLTIDLWWNFPYKRSTSLEFYDLIMVLYNQVPKNLTNNCGYVCFGKTKVVGKYSGKDAKKHRSHWQDNEAVGDGQETSTEGSKM